MFKRLLCVAAVLVMAGCSSPKFDGKPLEETNQSKQLTIVEDDATRDIFLASMLNWCDINGYTCKVVVDGTTPKEDELTLDYVSRWSWDFKTFIADARITAYQEGQRVGYVTFKAPNQLTFDKYGSDEERIKAMMDVLFKITSAKEATRKASNGEI
ncbi:Sbal_3080 family lipoprotein [Vibrio tubiashii]|uniref:Sbal_3080 family lipoprotein n=1 Tax=Vibrio tubiashii TaxID=29498 RepID=UPI001EFEEE40|nr:Sbal_3080 family lipoprotein [Vibrio tubiashii]MCG9580162.1 Sbal_3080 family lipoprotein [Vibrio tubiashii]MCG9613753.1 Sbal_3080 family lipoprotein [Vibrio tubiashii]MCG9690147.1 Sbal_3080 family lipoprotein [Vibrio tubiashii]